MNIKKINEEYKKLNEDDKIYFETRQIILSDYYTTRENLIEILKDEYNYEGEIPENNVELVKLFVKEATENGYMYLDAHEENVDSVEVTNVQ